MAGTGLHEFVVDRREGHDSPVRVPLRPAPNATHQVPLRPPQVTLRGEKEMYHEVGGNA
jgi:hypothetical protein